MSTADRREVCSICLDRLCSKKHPVGAILPCKHCFHLRCYNRWHAAQVLAKKDAIRCPMCNGNVDRFLPNPRTFSPSQIDDVFCEAVLQLLFKTTSLEHIDVLKKLLTCLPDDETLAVNQKAMIESAAVMPVIVAVMEKYAHNPLVQSVSCRLLLQLFYVNGRGWDDFQASDGLQRVISALERYPENPVIQFRATGMLNNVTFHSKCRQAMVDSDQVLDVLEAVLFAMSNSPENARIQEWACCTLLRFARMSTALKLQIVSLGCHGLIGTVIDQHGDKPGLQNLARSLLLVLISETVTTTKTNVNRELGLSATGPTR